MRTLFVKIILFIIMLIALFIINMIAFRSDYPLSWLITFIWSVIFVIYFPYIKFFKIKNK
jgi:hypothetical protein